jgi:hypothetical protein
MRMLCMMYRNYMSSAGLQLNYMLRPGACLRYFLLFVTTIFRVRVESLLSRPAYPTSRVAGYSFLVLPWWHLKT